MEEGNYVIRLTSLQPGVSGPYYVKNLGTTYGPFLEAEADRIENEIFSEGFYNTGRVQLEDYETPATTRAVRDAINWARDNAERLAREAADTVQEVRHDELVPEGIIESALDKLEGARDELLRIQVMVEHNKVIPLRDDDAAAEGLDAMVSELCR